ncbi:MAG: SufS family cysteine desulfurase [Alphaproteobacteria bacterium]|nr:SufS family cysteine desulfurase [Alphaproteobacteria bacterium]
MAEKTAQLVTEYAEYLNTPWRKDFPVLQTLVHENKPLAFLDSAASAQKPVCVIEAMDEVLRSGYSNIHRGLYELSQNLSQAYEDVRRKISSFINALSDKNIVITRNATEGINLVAQSWGQVHLKAGDEILITEMEHHANIIPWVLLAGQIGVVLKVAPLLEDGTLDIEAFHDLIGEKTKLVSIVQVSNVLGVVNPVTEIIAKIRTFNSDIKVLVDGSQGIVHQGMDVQIIDPDFYVFTGHKIYGPTGVGVLYGKADVLEEMAPYQGGGDMIGQVSFTKGITYREPPYRFEAGTPPIVEVIGLGAALDYIDSIGMDNIIAHEHALSVYALDALQDIDGVNLYGTQDLTKKDGIFSFSVDGAHSSDVATILDQCGVAVRNGHHCAMPLMEALGIDSTVRASFGLYTNKDDIDALIAGLHKVKGFF